ncbi:MAG: hypothetical protein V5A39_10715 [Haloarculaceae archaeon]
MSELEEETSPSVGGSCNSSRFELEYLYDDGAEPAELTVFDPDSSDISTAWMTVDVGIAVSLDRIR